MSEKEVNKLTDWKSVSINLQSTFLSAFGEYEWDSFQYYERKWLQQKVGYALFGPPNSLPEDKSDNQTGYTEKEFEDIKKICDKIVKEDMHGQNMGGETWLSIIFVCLEIPSKEKQGCPVLPIPVFRVPKHIKGKKETVAFIDSTRRVYTTWEDFLENNQLPACNYCYPCNGLYQVDNDGNVAVEFGNSPASNVSKMMLTVLDHTSTGLTLGAGAVSIAALFIPVAGPLIAASTVAGITAGIYGAGRTTEALVDRAKHNQSINIMNNEARNCWISLVGSVAGTASTVAMGAMTKIIQNGQVVGKTGRAVVNVLNFGSLAVNGVAIVNNIFLLHEKYNKDELTSLDIFQFSTSVFFFAHATFNIKTAGAIIKDTQNNAIQDFEASLRSNRHRKMFRKVARNTQRGMGDVEGKAKVIRSINHIDNKNDFFAGLIRSDKDVRKTKSSVKFTETGHVEVNENLTIDPMKFSEISRDQRQAMLKATKNLTEGKLSENQFTKVMNRMHVKPDIQINDITLNISKLLDGGSEYIINNKSELILKSLAVYDVYKIMINVDKKLHLRLLHCTVKVSELMEWPTGGIFLQILDFICKFVYKVASDMEKASKEDGSNEKDKEEIFLQFCSIVVDYCITDPNVRIMLKNAIQQLKCSTEEDVAAGSLDVCYEKENAWGYSSGAQYVPCQVMQRSKENPFVKHHQFWATDGEFHILAEDEIYDLAEKVTGLCVDYTNSLLDYDGIEVRVNIMTQEGVTPVQINCDIENNTITAYVA